MPISELTGEEIGASSEEYRHECECRWLLSHFQTADQRREHLRKLAVKRGQAAADRLMNDARRIWEKRRQEQLNELRS